MLKLKNVSKYYYNKGLITSGFSKVNLEFNIGEFVAITGASGSGKSTLLNVLSGLDSYEEGEMYINGKETSHYTEKDFENYRRKYVSNIFQNFNLVNSYTVYQNVELVLLLNGYKKREIKNKVLELLKKVDMYKFRNTKVAKLSGGQKQRVAIARALAKETPIIIADEPTGSLDRSAADSIIELLSEISKDKLVIIVTHNYEQVEKYVTRKISMHDGKVIEDITIQKCNTSDNDVTLKDFKSLSNVNKIRLGIRNTFNIKLKFLLLLLVFIFVIFSFAGTYASTKNKEFLEEIDGYTNYFTSENASKRIVVKKKDKTYFTDNDFNNITNTKNISKIVKNDLVIDKEFTFKIGNDFVMWSKVKNISDIKESDIDIGRMPTNPYEIVVSGDPNYQEYLKNAEKILLNKETYLGTYKGISYNAKTFKIVGVVLDEVSVVSTYSVYNTIYASDTVLDYLNNISLVSNYTSIKEEINNNTYNIYVKPSNLIKQGEAYIDENLNIYCKQYNCKNEDMNIKIKNIYFENNIAVKITNIYNSTNIKKLLNIDNYDDNGYTIYINDSDYENLFGNSKYQVSVIVDDEKNLYKVNENLEELGFTTLIVKDTLVKTGTTEIFMLMEKFFVVGLLIALFFIAYFIIKLILKSRNVYYATLRILGANKKITKELLTIELLNVSTIAYIVFIGTVTLVKMQILNINMSDIIRYLSVKEYIIIYLIITLMAYLISNRYSRKLFKDTTMNTIREEV